MFLCVVQCDDDLVRSPVYDDKLSLKHDGLSFVTILVYVSIAPVLFWFRVIPFLPSC